MKNGDEKTYEQNGKTIKIIPIKKVRKTESKQEATEGKETKVARVKKPKKTDEEKGKAKFAVGDRVTLKHIPVEYSGSGFTESVIIKVFKSTHDQMYRYSIRSITGHEMSLVKEEQIKPRKINFTK